MGFYGIRGVLDNESMGEYFRNLPFQEFHIEIFYPLISVASIRDFERFHAEIPESVYLKGWTVVIILAEMLYSLLPLQCNLWRNVP